MDLKKFHFVQRFFEQVEKYKDREALRHKVENQWVSISWEELGQEVLKIARTLIFSGIEIQDKIGIFSTNTPKWTMIDVGTSAIRACAIPIYPTSTPEMSKHIVDDAQIKILFVGAQQQYDVAWEIRESCPSLQKIVAIDDKIVLKDQEMSVHLSRFLNLPESKKLTQEVQKRIDNKQILDIYTIIYTSGTTGRPKGVIVDYENVAYQMINHDATLKVKEGKLSLSFLPLSHVFERIWTAYILHKGVINCYLEDTTKVAEALKEVKPHYMCVVPRLLEKIYAKVYQGVTTSNLIKRLIFSFSVKSGKQMLKVRQKNKKPSFLLQKSFNFADKVVFEKLRNALGGNIEMIPCGGANLETSIGKFFQAIGVNVLLGYGMTETTATVCFWSEKLNFKSVGKILPNIEVKIGENNEILIKGGSITKGYYNNPEETQKSFTADGFLKTGDAGNLDKEGNLYFTERIKELMKTSTGRYIAPQQIEGKIGKDSFIEQIVVIAEGRNFVSALIVPNFDSLNEYVKELGMKFENNLEMIKSQEIIEMIEKRLQRWQREMPDYQQIKKFTLLANPFSVDKNELTPTLKFKRKIIDKNYQKEIEAMYF